MKIPMRFFRCLSESLDTCAYHDYAIGKDWRYIRIVSQSFHKRFSSDSVAMYNKFKSGHSNAFRVLVIYVILMREAFKNIAHVPN